MHSYIVIKIWKLNLKEWKRNSAYHQHEGGFQFTDHEDGFQHKDSECVTKYRTSDTDVTYFMLSLTLLVYKIISAQTPSAIPKASRDDS